jgi:hypothetical protein
LTLRVLSKGAAEARENYCIPYGLLFICSLAVDVVYIDRRSLLALTR